MATDPSAEPAVPDWEARAAEKGWPPDLIADAAPRRPGDRVVHVGVHAIGVRTAGGAVLRTYRTPDARSWTGAAFEWAGASVILKPGSY